MIPAHITKLMSPADQATIAGSPTLTQQASDRAAKRGESAIQSEIVAWLRLHEIVVGVQRMDRRASMVPGWPDLVFCMPPKAGDFVPRPVAMECKTAIGKCSIEQLKTLQAMKNNGWAIKVVRSSKEAIDWLKNLL